MTREEVMKAYEACTPVKSWKMGEAFIVYPEENGDHTAEIIGLCDIKEAIAQLWVKDAHEFEQRSYKVYNGHYEFVIEYITADDYDYEYVDEEKIFDIEKLKEYFENHLEDFTYDIVFVDYDDLEDINAD